MLQFDEAELYSQLERLVPKFRIIFAASCATRLIPAYMSYSKQSGKGNPELLESTLNRLWDNLAGVEVAESDIQSYIDTCMELIPQQDERPWIMAQAYAEDASAAITYAWRCCQTGSAQEAIWAARRVYEAVDYYVIYELSIEDNRALEHSTIQAELTRQERDINELLASSEGKIVSLVAEFHNRAIDEAKLLFLAR